MTLQRSKKFLKQYAKLPESIRKKVERQILVIAQNMRHPSIAAKKLQGHETIWEARIDYHFRMTFDINGNVLRLRTVGTHQVYRNP